MVGSTSESRVTELPTRKDKWNKMLWKKTECCRSVILRVIRMIGDIWMECIGYGLREDAEV